MLEHVSARVGQRVGLPLCRRAVVLGRARFGLRVEEGRDGVEHRGVVESADQPPTAADAIAVQAQFVDRDLPVVGLRAVGVQRLDQLGAAGGELGRGAFAAPGRELFLGTRPRLRGEPLGGGGVEQSGDDLHVPQARLARLEHRGGGAQPRWQRCAVQPDPRPDQGCGGQTAAGFGAVPAQQVAERGCGGAVAALGEDATSFDFGQRADHQSVDPPGHGFAQGQQAEQITVAGAGACQLGEPGQGRVDALRSAAGGVVGHELSLLDNAFESSASTLTYANRSERGSTEGADRARLGR